MKKNSPLFFAAILFLFQNCSTIDNSKFVEKNSNPKNVILFISDGCGFNHVDAASYYQYGKTGEQVYEKFPVKLAMATYYLHGNKYNPDSAWANFDWVKKNPTESAGAASAMATGSKTTKKSISCDTLNQPLETIVDKFEKLGKSTGVISTVPFSNATPAAFVAHNENRQNYREIAEEMILKSKADVIMGGGHPFYNPNGTLVGKLAERYVGQKEIWDMNNGGKPINDEDGKLVEESEFRYVGGKNVWQMLNDGNAGNDADGDGKNDMWNFIQDRESFQKYMKGEVPKRLIGIFKSGQASQVERDTANENWTPFSVPFIQTIPTLKEMTLSSINVLDENKNGFFLMAEGGAVDWAAHDNVLNRTIEEQIDFNLAVEAACDWVEKNSSWDETLIIVTADHETGYLLGPNSNEVKSNKNSEKWKHLTGNGKGNMPNVEWFSKGHTNSLVPFYAKGNGSLNFLERIKGDDPVFGKFIDNTDIGIIIKSFN
ncbi:MAG: alkaline phosphatase [Ignavibacteriae bacterium]|nr:alkaline phosphatase [Ignavibacteriota bacterium]